MGHGFVVRSVIVLFWGAGLLRKKGWRIVDSQAVLRGVTDVAAGFSVVRNYYPLQ